MKHDLATLTAEIHACIVEQDRAGLRVAELVLHAKEQCFPDGLAWLDWCHNEFGFRRRHAFRLARVGDLVRSIPDLATKISARGGTNYEKIEEIAQIPTVAQVLKFLKTHAVSGMDREELREAVRAFLGKAPVEKQLTFLFYGKMPTPAELMAGLDSPKCKGQIKLQTEVDYLMAHFRRIEAIHDEVSPKDLAGLARMLQQNAQIITHELATRKAGT